MDEEEETEPTGPIQPSTSITVTEEAEVLQEDIDAYEASEASGRDTHELHGTMCKGHPRAAWYYV